MCDLKGMFVDKRFSKNLNSVSAIKVSALVFFVLYTSFGFAKSLEIEELEQHYISKINICDAEPAEPLRKGCIENVMMYIDNTIVIDEHTDLRHVLLNIDILIKVNNFTYVEEIIHYYTKKKLDVRQKIYLDIGRAKLDIAKEKTTSKAISAKYYNAIETVLSEAVGVLPSAEYYTLSESIALFLLEPPRQKVVNINSKVTMEQELFRRRFLRDYSVNVQAGGYTLSYTLLKALFDKNVDFKQPEKSHFHLGLIYMMLDYVTGAQDHLKLALAYSNTKSTMEYWLANAVLFQIYRAGSVEDLLSKTSQAFWEALVTDKPQVLTLPSQADRDALLAASEEITLDLEINHQGYISKLVSWHSEKTLTEAQEVAMKKQLKQYRFSPKRGQAKQDVYQYQLTLKKEKASDNVFTSSTIYKKLLKTAERMYPSLWSKGYLGKGK